jgi:hypothetical protein
VVYGRNKTESCTRATILFVEKCIARLFVEKFIARLFVEKCIARLFVEKCIAVRLSVVSIKLRSSLASQFGHVPRILNVDGKNWIILKVPSPMCNLN